MSALDRPVALDRPLAHHRGEGSPKQSIAPVVRRLPPASRPNGSDVCVLMATYRGETADNLDRCLGSLAAQGEMPGRVVLVVDGPVDDDQERVMAARSIGLPLHLVRLPTGGGLARALNAGLPHCREAYVMRMDTDDVCRPDRVETQMRYLREHPDVDFLSSWARETSDDDGASSIKVSATEHEHVVRALRWRNVIVHPSVVVRTKSLRLVGGYRPDFGMMEDYDLFVRLAQAGARFHVLPKVLVDVTTNSVQRRRRGGFAYLRNEVAFRRSLLASGFVGFGEFLLTTVLYAAFRVVSGPLRGRLYALVRS